MRKKTLKKLQPNRNKIFKFLRTKDHLIEIMSRKGTSIYLNLMKHLLLNKPYKNIDYNKELLRFAKHNMNIQKQTNGRNNESTETSDRI